MPASTFVVTGSWLNPNNTPAAGTVEFTPLPQRLVNGGQILPQEAYVATLSSGSINVTLVQSVSGYTVKEKILGATEVTYTIPGTATVDLASVNPASLTGVPLSTNYQGAWSSLVTYAPNQIVTYAGGAYMALTASLNVVPNADATKWGFLSGDGAVYTPPALTSTVVVNLANGPVQLVPLTAAFTTITFSGFGAGSKLELLLTGTAPLYVTWPSSVVFSGGNAPALGAATKITFRSFDGVTIYADGGPVPGIDPASIPTLQTLNEARRNYDVYAEGAALNAATIPSAVGTSLTTTAVANTFQKTWAPLDYVRSGNVFGDRMARYNLTPVGGGLLHNPGVALGANGNPFTVFYVFEFVDSFPQCFIADRTTYGNFSIDHSSFNQVSTTSGATFTQVGAPTSPLGYRPAANFRTPQVLAVKFTGNNADAEPLEVRINGIACTRAGTKPSVPALNGFALGRSPGGGRDALHWATAYALFTSALDFSTPWSAGRMMERYLGSFVGYSL